MPDGLGSLQPEDVLLSIDTAISQLVLARRMVMRYTEQPDNPDGACKHLRQVETYAGSICQDCGANLSTNDDGVPPSATD